MQVAVAVIGSGVFATALTGWFTWRIAKRQRSGTIGTSEAATLWQEANAMRSELREEAAASRREVLAMREEAVTMRTETLALRNEAVAMRAEMVTLRSEAALCRREVVSLRRQLKIALNK